MIINYLKITFRFFKRNISFSVITILGLGLGMAVFMLIMNYVRYEKSYDQHYKNADRIYRIPMESTEKNGKIQTFAFTYPAVAPALIMEFPEVEKAARFRRRGGVVRTENNSFVEDGQIFYADSSALEIFNFQFFKKSPDLFQNLNDAIITRSTANKFFGKEDVINETFKFEGENYVVKGILENFSENTHLKFNILLNFKKYIQLTNGAANTSWFWSDFYTYILLKENVEAEALQNKLTGFAEKYMGKDMEVNNYTLNFQLQPLLEIHSQSHYDYELPGNGNYKFLIYLTFAGIFILIIAWINYINLSTAKAMERAKEVGIRKVIGATKGDLIKQFFTESFILNLMGFIVGLVIFYISLPFFAELISRDIQLLKIIPFKFWMILVLIFFSGTILSAFYPAIILSSFNPQSSIKQKFQTKFIPLSGTSLRKGLVIFQFSIAVILISGAIGFYLQLNFMQNKDLGFSVSNKIVLKQSADVDSTYISKISSFKSDLLNQSGVKSVTMSSSVPGGEVEGSAGFYLENSTLLKRFRLLGIEEDFIDSYNLKILHGKELNKYRELSDTTVTQEILINENAVKVLGFSNGENIVGKKLVAGNSRFEIIGVVGDYHQQSLSHTLDPIIFYLDDLHELDYYTVTYDDNLNTGEFLTTAGTLWKRYFPENPLNYFFLDDHYYGQYNTDKLFSTIIWIFTAVAILIACMGLFGLSIFIISKKRKEISIRSVLGATTGQILFYITKDFMKLVIIAGLIAIPISYIVIKNWLEKFPYRIDIELFMFLIPLIGITLIALLTILYHAIMAAVKNPIDDLRLE